MRSRRSTTWYNLKPVGRNKLTICTNLRARCRRRLPPPSTSRHKLASVSNETTADGCVTLKEGECMGACGDAPVLLHNNKRMLCAMNAEKLDALIKELK